MSDAPVDRQYVRVVCRVCGTRIVEVARRQPHTAKCPDCFTEVTIPAVGDIPSAAPPKPLPEVGTYRIEYDNGVTPEQARQTNAKRARRERAMVLVICPLCAARIDTLARKEPRTVKCPDCHELVRIPSQAEVDEKRRKSQLFGAGLPTPPRRQPKVTGSSGRPAVGHGWHGRETGHNSLPIPAPTARAPESPTFLSDALSHIRREEDSPPPKWTFFSRVFSIPWHAEVVSRWIYLTIGLLAMNLLIGFGIELGLQMAGSRFGMVVAFFVLPLIWIGTWTISYAAACSRAILEDTANGSDRITSWHEPNWREWVLVLICVGFLGSVAVIIGYFAGRLIELAGGPFLPTVVGIAWLVFPFILLSSLETNSLLTPFSGRIFHSLWRHAGGWILFTILSTVIAAVPVAILLVPSGWPLTIRAAIASPLIAAAILIHARLLGRLGWLITRND